MLYHISSTVAIPCQSVGTQDAADAIVAAIESVLKEGPRTSDLAGNANTAEVGNAIAARIGLANKE
jgi:tartrate dehydrogenase/decarboxylase/D-malate dehydrogenase